MVKKKLPVRWSPKAEQRLDGIYDYIAEDSVSAARHVKKTLGHFPEKYSKEEYLTNEPKNYRSVSKWRYKLIYEVTDVYLSPEVNVANYDALLQAIEDYFGITLNENRVSIPITGSSYGLNITQDGSGAVTVLRGDGNTHIGANINLPGLLREDIKERMGRWYQFTDVTTRSNNFMNQDPSLPSIEDRAIVYDYFDHQDGIEDGDATYSYYYIQKPNDGGF